MKRIVNSVLIIALLLLTVSLVSCGTIDKRINEATATLNEEISRLEADISGLDSQIVDLNGQIERLEGENTALGTDKSELESEKAALEKEKAALEAEKSALEKEKAALQGRLDEMNTEIRCESGIHFYDGESEIAYSWSGDHTQCLARFTCEVCGDQATLKTDNITKEEDDRLLAYFDDYVPSTSFDLPVFTGVYFNTDSEGYNAETNTFTLTKDTPFVLTFTGKNLLNITAENNHLITFYRDNRWYLLDYVVNNEYGHISITDTDVTVTIDTTYMDVLDWYDEFYGFAMFDQEPSKEYESTRIMVTLQKESLPVDSEGYTLVSDGEELESALQKGGKIRLAADIECESGLEVYNESTLDLAGYDIRIVNTGLDAFYVYDGYLDLYDSVGGSRINAGITIHNGMMVRINDAIEFENDINLSGCLDLSGYTGEELHVYVYDSASDLIIPDGYAMYGLNGELIPDFAAAKEMGDVFVRPIQQGSDPDEPTESNGFPAFTLPTEAKVNFADYNIPVSDIIAFFPGEVEMKYEGGVFTVNNIGATQAFVYDMKTYGRTELALVDGVWTTEVELDSSVGIGVDFFYRSDDTDWHVQYEKGSLTGYLQVNDNQTNTVFTINLNDNSYLLQLDYGNNFISELTYVDGKLTQEKTTWLASDNNHFVEVFYDSDHNYVRTTIYVYSTSEYYGHFPEGWSLYYYKYIEGGVAAPGYENYTAEDFMALCPSAFN